MARELPKAHAAAAAKAHAARLMEASRLAPPPPDISEELACPVCKALLVLVTRVETQVLSVEQAATAAGLPSNWKQLRPGRLEDTVSEDWQTWLEFKKWKEWKDSQQGGGGSTGTDDWWHGYGHGEDVANASASSSSSGFMQRWQAAPSSGSAWQGHWRAAEEEEAVTTTVKRARRTL